MKNSLVWFTNNLRVFDNKVLKEACDQADTMYAIYCFDPRQFAETQFGFKKTGVFRAQFLIESVQNLSENLKRLNIPLYIKFAKPEEQIPKLCQKHNITHVYHQNEWTQEEKKCIENLSKAIPNTVI